jgi:hypothetical protein
MSQDLQLISPARYYKIPLIMRPAYEEWRPARLAWMIEREAERRRRYRGRLYGGVR